MYLTRKTKIIRLCIVFYRFLLFLFLIENRKIFFFLIENILFIGIIYYRNYIYISSMFYIYIIYKGK